MADDNRILQMVLEVKDQDVVKATTNVAALENRIKKLIKAQQAGKITDDQFRKGKSQITSALSEMANVSKNKAERAVRSLISTESKLTREVRVNTVALSSNATAAKSASGAMNQYGTVSGLAGKKLNTFNMKIQQGGYQLQDFAVQMQGGTSFFTAFAQQGSQFAGVFGPAGAVVGAVIAIGSAIAGIAYNSARASSGVKDLEKDIENLTAAFDLLESTDLSGFGGISASVTVATNQYRDLLTAMNEVAEARRLEAMARVLENVAPQTYSKSKISQQLYTEQAFSGSRRGALSGASGEMLRQLKVGKALLSIQGKTREEFAKNLSEAIKYLDVQGLLSEELKGQLVDVANQSGLQGVVTAALEDSVTAGEKLAKVTDKTNSELEKSVRLLQAARDKRQASAEGIYRSLQGEIKLQKTILAYGKDSTEAKKLMAEQARASFAEELKSKDLADGQIEVLLKQYDISVEKAATEDRIVKTLLDEDAIMGQIVGKNKTSLGLEQQRLTLMQTQAALIADRTTEPSQAGRSTGLYGKGTPFVYSGPKLDENNNVIPDKDKTLSGTTLEDLEAEANARMAALRLGDTELAMYEKQLIIRQALGDYSEQYSDAAVMAAAERLILLQKEEDQLELIKQKNKELADTIVDSFANSFMSIVDGTATVKDAFRDMARDIITHLYKVLVLQQMINALGGSVGGPIGDALKTFKFANGGAISGGNVIPFASGGVVGSPTTFGMSGGRTGLMGEAGPEAIMPLQRGPNGKLGVTVNGGDGGGVTVNQVINISTGVQQTVRAEIKSMMPQIADNAKAAVLDAKRRGGSYGGAF